MREHIPHKISHKKLCDTPRLMMYDGEKDFSLWQNDALDKLKELIGLDNFEKCDDLFEIEYEKERELFREIRFSFQSEEGYFVPGYLLIPKGAKLPNDTVICLQGHSTGMHVSLGIPINEEEERLIPERDKDFAVSAVKHGYNAVIIEQRCMGECGGKTDGNRKPDCYQSSVTNLLIGRTTIGERVWDIQRLIDVLEKYFPEVNTDTLGCMGNSGGGTATFYASCIEKRIKISMPSCALCTYEKSIGAMFHCSCNYIPSVRKYFEMGDLCGLIPPGRMVMISGKTDGIFPIDGAEETYHLAKKMFEYADVPENLTWVVGEEGHRFYQKPGWDAYGKMLKEVK